jgi:single-strand DNA-binding protein
MDMQRTEIIGHIAQTAKPIEFLPSGQPFTSFTIACNRRYKGADGQMKEKPLFMTCKLFGKRAEKLAADLTKGKKIRVEGVLEQSRWEKDGQKHSRIDLLVNSVLFLSPKAFDEDSVPADLAHAA